jgi:hypothetical protein
MTPATQTSEPRTGGTANERLRAESWTDPDLGFAVVPLQDAERELNLLYGIIERLAEVAALPAEPAGLDMERLREAFTFLGSDDVLADGSIWTVDEMAERVAAAYAEGEPE